MPGYFPKTSK